MTDANIRRIDAGDRSWLREMLDMHWGGTTMVVHGEEIDVLCMQGLVAGEREGITIFRVGERSELLLLHALREGCGLGTLLLNAVIAEVRINRGKYLLATTTNDNVNALRFYQKRGFRLLALRPGAVNEARRMKPRIPFVGKNGIPLRDEIDLMLTL